MRRLSPAALLRALLSTLSLFPMHAMGADSFRIEYFPISGTTATELRADLSRKGPVGETGTRSDGQTKYRIAWSVSMESKDGSCRGRDANVDLEVTMLLPRWEKPANASPELVESWNHLSAVLREHEDGHHRIAIAAAKEVQRKLNKRARADTCDALEARINDTANAVLRKYRNKQEAYDEKTDFGRKQTTGILRGGPSRTSGR